jgi:hypothetical protein
MRLRPDAVSPRVGPPLRDVTNLTAEKRVAARRSSCFLADNHMKRNRAATMSSASNANKPMTPLEWAMLVTLSVLWGGSFFNGIAVKELATFTVVASRVGLAAVVLLAA